MRAGVEGRRRPVSNSGHLAGHLAQTKIGNLRENDVSYYSHYGITGYGVFKAGKQNWKGFCIKINCSQMKLLNFVSPSGDSLSKSANFGLSK